MARSGLRMMPTFPSSPLRFRKAGFPRYGSKGAGTAQLHRTATYMCCLRCAGAPRRPASGSALLPVDPSQHVILYVPGEPLAAYVQFLRDALLPSPVRVRLGTPNVSHFGAYWFTIATTC